MTSQHQMARTVSGQDDLVLTVRKKERNETFLVLKLKRIGWNLFVLLSDHHTMHAAILNLSFTF